MRKFAQNMVFALVGMVLAVGFQVTAHSQASETPSRTTQAVELFSFVTAEKEYVADPMQLTASQAAQFIPQHEEVQKVYWTMIDEGIRPVMAMIEVQRHLHEFHQQQGNP